MLSTYVTYNVLICCAWPASRPGAHFSMDSASAAKIWPLCAAECRPGQLNTWRARQLASLNFTD